MAAMGQMFDVFEDFVSPSAAAVNFVIELVKVRTASSMGMMMNVCQEVLGAYVFY